jgi:hypothetical protein
MKEFFKYFFYKMYKRDYSTHNAAVALSGTQLMFVINFIIFTIIGPFDIYGKLTGTAKTIAILLFLAFAFFNLNYYSKRIDEFEEKWGNESKKEKRIGMLKIVLFVIVSWGFCFVNAWIYNRYK